MAVNVTVRGGKRARRVVEAAIDGTFQEVALVAAARVIQRRLVPRVKSKIPVRSGRLRRTLRIAVIPPGTIRLRGIFYGRFARIGRERDTVAEIAMKELIDIWPSIRSAMVAAIRNEVARLRG